MKIQTIDDAKTLAMHLADLGYSVIPVGADKRPTIGWAKYQERIATKEEIDGWWAGITDDQSFGVGIVTGHVSGRLVVVDVDGDQNDWPTDPDVRFDVSRGLIVKTGGGGRHYWLRMPEGVEIRNSASLIAHKVDVRGEGGYVVAPGSKHPSGNYYEIAGDDEIPRSNELPEASDWLISAATRKTEKNEEGIIETTKEYGELINGVGDGQRNETLARLVGRYAHMGMSYDEILGLMTAWNKNNKPPLGIKELSRTVRSIVDRELIKTGQITPSQAASGPSGMLAALNEMTGLEVIQIIRVSGDEPYYTFHFGNGEYVDVLADELLTWGGWAKKMLRAAGRMPIKVGKKWEQCANLIIKCAMKVDAGAQARVLGTIQNSLSQYIAHCGMVPETEDPKRDDLIVFRDGKVGISCTALAEFIKNKGAGIGNGGSKKLAQLLSGAGFSHIKKKIPRSDNTTLHIAHYIIPDKILFELGAEDQVRRVHASMFGGSADA